MRYRKPPCGRTEEHHSHFVMPQDYYCTGWTGMEAGAVALFVKLGELEDLQERGVLPGGTRLVCHPAVERQLIVMSAPSYSSFIKQQDHVTTIPIAMDAGLEPGQWRIVMGEGKIR